MSNNLKKKEKSRIGRPLKLSTEEELEKIKELASIGCNAEIIAVCMNVDVATIERSYAGIIKDGRFILRKNLLAALYDKAVNKLDTTCLIWLSKQYLGFKEPKQEVEQTNMVPYQIQIMDYSKSTNLET